VRSETIVFRVLKKWSRLSATGYSPACEANALKEILQVHLNCLACRNDLCFFTASGHIPNDHYHERFNSFLQFPDLLFNSRGVLVRVYLQFALRSQTIQVLTSHTSMIVIATPRASFNSGTGTNSAADCNTFITSFPPAVTYS